jgi:hypothetical protein
VPLRSVQDRSPVRLGRTIVFGPLMAGPGSSPHYPTIRSPSIQVISPNTATIKDAAAITRHVPLMMQIKLALIPTIAACHGVAPANANPQATRTATLARASQCRS